MYDKSKRFSNLKRFLRHALRLVFEMFTKPIGFSIFGFLECCTFWRKQEKMVKNHREAGGI